MKTIKKLAILCIIIALALTTAISAFAVDWNYNGTGGATTTGGHSVSGKYFIGD